MIRFTMIHFLTIDEKFYRAEKSDIRIYIHQCVYELSLMLWLAYRLCVPVYPSKYRKQSYLWHTAGEMEVYRTGVQNWKEVLVLTLVYFKIQHWFQVWLCVCVNVLTSDIVGTCGRPEHRTGCSVTINTFEGCLSYFPILCSSSFCKNNTSVCSDDRRIERRSVEGIGKLNLWCLGHIFIFFYLITLRGGKRTVNFYLRHTSNSFSGAEFTRIHHNCQHFFFF